MACITPGMIVTARKFVSGELLYKNHYGLCWNFRQHEEHLTGLFSELLPFEYMSSEYAEARRDGTMLKNPLRVHYLRSLAKLPLPGIKWMLEARRWLKAIDSPLERRPVEGICVHIGGIDRAFEVLAGMGHARSAAFPFNADENDYFDEDVHPWTNRTRVLFVEALVQGLYRVDPVPDNWASSDRAREILRRASEGYRA